ITNSTYAYESMKQGDAFAKKFGGVGGNDEDWFKVTVHSYFQGMASDSLDIYLADFRFADNSKDYIMDTWNFYNTPSYLADSLVFIVSSSDTGSFGMNTPAYFCLDNIKVHYI